MKPAMYLRAFNGNEIQILKGDRSKLNEFDFMEHNLFISW